MAKSARPVVLLAVTVMLAGCGSPGFDKAGGRQARHLERADHRVRRGGR